MIAIIGTIIVHAAVTVGTITGQPVTVPDGTVSEATWWCLRDMGHRGVADGREALVNVPAADVRKCEV